MLSFGPFTRPVAPRSRSTRVSVTKRSRGSRRPQTSRPGTRAPIGRAGRPANRSAGAAAETAAGALAPERLETVVTAAEPEEVLARAPGAAHPGRPRTLTGRQASAALAARAATEYVYVAQDLRRIVVVAAILFGIMLALYVLIVVVRVIPLPFY